MSKKEKVYLKDTAIWDSIDHEGSAELFPETYAKLDSLTQFSNKKLSWKCSIGHVWQAQIDNRSGGNRCPFCSGRRVSGTNCLSTIRPELAIEWDFDRNELTPYDVTEHSGKSVWWKCSVNHVWQAKIYNRSNGSGCPFCSGLRVTDNNRLSIKNLELALEWDPDKNELTPDDVSVYSDMKVGWKCAEGHRWQASIKHRSNGRGCPFCSGHRVTDNSRLSIKNPELACEWDFDKNESTPDEVSVSSDRKVGWKCSEGHRWQASIKNRSNGNGCPTCAKRFGKIEKRFIESFTERTDFTVTAHGMRLNQISYSSGRSGVEVDIILYRNGHYLLLEYDGAYWHRNRADSDMEKSRALLSLGDNVLHARIRERIRGNDLPDLDLVHDRFAQFRHDYHATESDSIERTVKRIEKWFTEKIGE